MRRILVNSGGRPGDGPAPPGLGSRLAG